MKHPRVISSLLTALIAVPLLAGTALAASTPTGTTKLYLQPATGSVAAGAEMRVAVRLTSNEAVNAVQANLSYPANMLQYVSVDGAGTAFDVAAPTTGGSGSVKIARGAMKPVNGDALVATVVFKGIAHGTAHVDFATGSAVPRSADAKDTLGSKPGGVYTVTGGPAPASLAPTPAAGGAFSGSPTPKPSLTHFLTLGTSSAATGIIALLVLAAIVVGFLAWRRRNQGPPPLS